jgi:transitional endoplasmic reticulum ATPase
VYVGEAERTVRDIFARARVGAPSVVFLDEVDALVGKRAMEGQGGGRGDSVQERILSTLLNEMDGVEGSVGVLVVGATNRPDMLDAALMRPGRFDRMLYIPPPDWEGRLEIWRIALAGMPSRLEHPLEVYANLTEGYTGADIKSVCREAGMTALRRGVADAMITDGDLEEGLAVVPPSLLRETLSYYEEFAQRGRG